MMTTIALAILAGVPAQPPELKLTNVRTTIGELGPPRENNKLLPGDYLFFAFDIEGLTINADGNTRYVMSMEVTDAAGKVWLPKNPVEKSDFIPLRGNRIPARAYVIAGLDYPPGNYTCKLSVTDPKTKATGSLTMKYEVAKKDFGIVLVNTSYDPQGTISAPTTGQVGQTIFISFSVVAFERDMKTKQPNVEIVIDILDEKNASLGQPLKHIQDDKSALPVKATDDVFRLPYQLFLTRPGKFTVQITATDNVSKKKATFKVPVTVMAAN